MLREEQRSRIVTPVGLDIGAQSMVVKATIRMPETAGLRRQQSRPPIGARKILARKRELL